MTESIASRYSSLTKQAEISNRLKAITKKDVREDDKKDDYAALYKHTKWINKLAPIARIKDRDYKAKVEFLTRAVS